MEAQSPEPKFQQFTMSDGYVHHYRHWRPESVPRSFIVALHGIQSHSGWYRYSCERLCAAGHDVRFLDRRGSGLNRTMRGHAPHHERLLNDVIQFLADVRAERERYAPNAPVVLLAISWSGKLGVTVCARRPDFVDGLGLLYPGICAKIRASRRQQMLLKIADWLGVQTRLVPIPLSDPALFTNDAVAQEFIRLDSLALHEVTTGFLNASLQLDRLAAVAPEKIRQPALLLLAGQDHIIDNQATRAYFSRIPRTDRQVIEYPQAAHTLEFEPNRDEFVDDLIEWIAGIERPA